MNPKSRERRSLLAVNLGLAANVLLATLKTAIGVLGHSPALLADGVNSTSDVAYYVVVRVFMRQARKPPDPEHPLGHGQLESIAAVVVGSFVITTAIAVFWNAVSNIYDLFAGQRDFGGASAVAVWVALFTVALKLLLAYFTQRVGIQTRNAAVLALAYDHRNDVFSALAAVVGIFFGRMGFPWMDPLAGALVALVILRTGIEILRESSADLMDTVPGEVLAGQIGDVANTIPAVQKVEEIYAHRFGPYLVVNLTIAIDGALSVTQGHDIASRMEHALYREIEFLRLAHVHCRPAASRLSESEAAPHRQGALGAG